MMKGRKIGTIAALGGSTAALAMLTGLAGARADDLQVNQQLLDTRIDQLAAVGQQPGAGNQFSIDHQPGRGRDAGHRRQLPALDPDPRHRHLDQDLRSDHRDPRLLHVGRQPGVHGQLRRTPRSATTARCSRSRCNNGGVAKARSNGIFGQSPRESKIGFETRTPTPFGEARTVFEFDWAGSTAAGPAAATRPRSPTTCCRACAMPTARWAGCSPVRRPRTSPTRTPTAKPSTSAAMSANRAMSASRRSATRCRPGGAPRSRCRRNSPRPSSPPRRVSRRTTRGFIPTATTTCTIAALAHGRPTCTTSVLTSGQLPLNIAKTTAPDFTAAWYLPQPWGHIDISGVLRPGIDVTDGHYFDQAVYRLWRPYRHRLQAGLAGLGEGRHHRALRGRRHDRPVSSTAAPTSTWRPITARRGGYGALWRPDDGGLGGG